MHTSSSTYHTSFGEMLFLQEIFPGCPMLGYAEYYYRAHGADVGFDPELAISQTDFPRIRLKNALTLSCLDQCVTAYAPTQWQRNTFPEAYHGKITVVHDGVDTRLLRRNASAVLSLPEGRTLSRRMPIVTFAARSLEHYRGFHKFWPALALVLARNEKAHAIIVGSDDVTYGPAASAEPLRERMLSLFPADLSRVHFFPSLDRASYIRMLQISSCHVYLTYPFVPSWSLLEAMACGAPVIASDVGPVNELADHTSCIRVDFFDTDGLANAMQEVLAAPDKYETMRTTAAARVRRLYDFDRISWPRLRQLIHEAIRL